MFYVYVSVLTVAFAALIKKNTLKTVTATQIICAGSIVIYVRNICNANLVLAILVFISVTLIITVKKCATSAKKHVQSSLII